MAIAPVQYGINLAPLNPAQQIMQGMQVGQGLLDSREQGLQRQQAAQMRPLEMQAAQLGLRQGLAAEADANVKRSMEQAMAQSAAIAAAQKQEAKQALMTQPLSTEALTKFSIQYPEEAKNLETTMARLSTEERRQRVGEAGQVRAALLGGNKEAALSFLNERASAYDQSSGSKEKGDALRALAQRIEQNPIAAANMLGAVVAMEDPEKFTENVEKSMTLEPTIRKTEAEADIANTNAEMRRKQIASALKLETAQAAKYYNDMRIDSKRLDLDERKFADESAARLKEMEFKATDLPTNLVAPVLKMSDESVAANLQADDWGKLASEFDKFKGGLGIGDTVPTGTQGKANELINSVLGRQDAVSVLRRRYDGMVAKGVVANLPTGAASDKDIALVKGGFPEGTDDPKLLADFSRAMERVNRADAKVKGARAEFLARNRGAGLARGGFTVAGLPVQAGETETDVMRRVFATSTQSLME